MSSKRKSDNSRRTDYKIYYGIPHCHTAYSTGRGTILEAIQHAKNNKIDYMFFSDHGSYLKKNIDSTNTRWYSLKQIIRRYIHKHKSFVPFGGFEYSMYEKLDVNVINSDECIYKRLNISEFARWLEKNSCICILNHPNECIRKIKSNESFKKYITSIEVGNGSYPFKYKRYYNYFYEMLDAGWKLGAVNGQDNHRTNWGDSENLTAILAKGLNKKSIEEAYKKHLTYSTESKSLKLFYKINDCFMGGTICVKEDCELVFDIRAEDSNYIINEIIIISNGGSVMREINNIQNNKVHCNFSIQSSKKNNWYIVNIRLGNNKEALTSPIFIRYS